MTPIEDTMIHAAERFLAHHSTADAAVLPLLDGKVVAVGKQATLIGMMGGIARAVEYITNQCFDASHAAGWWVNPRTGIDARYNPMCFSQKLMLIVSEVAEAMEGDRNNLMDDKLPHRPMREVELADALIRICDLAGAYGMDLGGAVAEKMAFNKVRPDHQAAARNAEGGKAY